MLPYHATLPLELCSREHTPTWLHTRIKSRTTPHARDRILFNKVVSNLHSYNAKAWKFPLSDFVFEFHDPSTIYYSSASAKYFARDLTADVVPQPPVIFHAKVRVVRSQICPIWQPPTCWQNSQRSSLTGLTHRVRDKMTTDNIFKWIFLNENRCSLINISLKFLFVGPVDNKSVLAWAMVCCQAGDKSLFEPKMTDA